MKFNKLLNETSSTFKEPLLQHSILPYKYWKKYIKHNKNNLNTQTILQELIHQCNNTDRIFIHGLNGRMRTPKYICPCFSNNKIQIDNVNDKDLITFSEINQKALYKICKKLQKNGADDLMRFYINAKTKKAFKFLGNHELTYLKLMQNNNLKSIETPECPICMDEDSLPLVITDCEHYICLKCLIDITNTNNIKGTLYNRLLIGLSNFSCPMCRKYNPIKKIDKYHFYPKAPKNILN